MNILKSIFLGIIQGATEFLPVSSSGHLAIFKKLFGVNLDSGIYFDVLLHFGTLIALIIVFHDDIWHMIQEFFQMIGIVLVNLLVFIRRKRKDTRYTYFKVVNSNYKKLVLMVILSTIPTGIIGIAGNELMDRAGDVLWLVGLCLMGTGVLLFIADRYSENTMKIKQAKYSDAFFIGIAQGVATLPGLSRSGTTISAGMKLGFNKNLAIKYSFLMSVPAVLGAVIVKIKNLKGEAFGSHNLPGYVLGAVAAGVTGYFALRFLLKLVKTKNYKGFTIYCLAMGVFAIILNFIK